VTNKQAINERIWQIVAMIPPGRVSTYGEIARQAGMPGAARRVGKALRDLPGDTRIPWYRVVNSQGRISLPEGSSSRNFQRKQLETEGCCFNAANRLDLKQYGWP
jgi:methylated-DNA-protein-cysteine methyltransferase-like protein